MVIIYKAEEAEKHSIGRVFHFDLIWFPWKCFNLIIRGNGNQFLSLSVFQVHIVFGLVKLNKREVIKKFLLNDHVDWNFKINVFSKKFIAKNELFHHM